MRYKNLEFYLKTTNTGIKEDMSTLLCNMEKNFYVKNGFKVIQGEFWNDKIYHASIHNVSYKGATNPVLTNFFISMFTEQGAVIYDPFAGRGTTALEAALWNRSFVVSDLNPLLSFYLRPRIGIPKLKNVLERLDLLKLFIDTSVDIEKEPLDLLSMFNQKTIYYLIAYKNYFLERKESKQYDRIDAFINMVLLNDYMDIPSIT